MSPWGTEASCGAAGAQAVVVVVKEHEVRVEKELLEGLTVKRAGEGTVQHESAGTTGALGLNRMVPVTVEKPPSDTKVVQVVFLSSLP